MKFEDCMLRLKKKIVLKDSYKNYITEARNNFRQIVYLTVMLKYGRVHLSMYLEFTDSATMSGCSGNDDRVGNKRKGHWNLCPHASRIMQVLAS